MGLRESVPALDDGDGFWTQPRVLRTVKEVAERYGSEAEVEPGERIALEGPLTADYVVRLFALARCHATVVPLHAGWTEAERTAALEGLGVHRILGQDGKFSDGPGGAPLPEPPRVRDEDDEEEPEEEDGGPPPIPFALLWTSGTSGSPRGIAISTKGLEASCRATEERLGLRIRDRWYACLSPAHIGGLALLTRTALLDCTALVRTEFDEHEFLRMAGDRRLTHASLVPTMLRRLVRAGGMTRAPKSLGALLIGGDAVDRDLAEEAVDLRYPLALTYGLTEATSQVATATPDEVKRALLGSDELTVGTALDGVELRIGDLPGEFDPGDFAEGVGEILVKGPTVAQGIVDPDDPGTLLPLTDDDGWLHTDDLGRMDDQGRLVVAGRSSRRIVTGGATVDPGEVEEALRALDEVADACVVGIEDSEWGQRIAAALVWEGGDGSGPPDPDAVRDRLQERLSKSKLPRDIRFVDEMPLNANGKKDLAGLVDLFQ